MGKSEIGLYFRANKIIAITADKIPNPFVIVKASLRKIKAHIAVKMELIRATGTTILASPFFRDERKAKVPVKRRIPVIRK